MKILDALKGLKGMSQSPFPKKEVKKKTTIKKKTVKKKAVKKKRK